MTTEEYLAKILQEIETARINGRKGVFKVNEKIPDGVAHYVRDYLTANTPYHIEFRRCPKCTRTWDVMIIF